MVYNRRKRGGDNASEYFNNTAMVAGVKDARHQALMPDVLHFLGINRIDNLISMSNLKYDAIVKSGIKVGKRYEIPDELIPADSRVEIDAKVCFCTSLLCNAVKADKTASQSGERWDADDVDPVWVLFDEGDDG